MFGKNKSTEKKNSKTKKSPSKTTARKTPSDKAKGKSLSLAPAGKPSSATLSPRGSAPKTPSKSSGSTKNQTRELAEFIKQKKASEPETQYIANEDHYEKVIEKIKDCKKTLWIGTADIKDLYVKDGKNTKPLLEVLSDLAKAGVAIRLIHAKEPGPAFREDFDKYPALLDGMERVLCPRVHFKIIILDLKTAYVGSANLTGAGLGMKGENTRNFEAGVLSSNKDFVKQAASQFDSVWMGSFCKNCRRKEYCPEPLCTD